MNEEIEDCNIIIQDFTAVSEWEIFILRVEEAINNWKLKKSPKGKVLESKDFNKYPWKISKENIPFAGEEFTIARYTLLVPDPEVKSNEEEEKDKNCQAFSDLYVATNDFDQLNAKFRDEIPFLSVWYGLRDFAVLTCPEEIIDEGKIKVLLSSISIAVNNTGCEIPVFIQCHEAWQQYYLGICENNGLCIKFDTIHLRRIPAQCYYLSGLLNVFKDKISSNITLDPVRISVRFSYKLSEWPSSSWTQRPPDFDFLLGQPVEIENFSMLPFGAVHEPIKSFNLHVSWMRISDNTIIDSETYSDLTPMKAHIWSMDIDVDKPICLLCEHYSEFINFHKNHDRLSDILYDTREYDFISRDSKFPSVKPMSTSSSRLLEDSPMAERDQSGNLSNDVIVTLLKYIFIHSKADVENVATEDKSQFIIGENMKADPNNGLLWRLAITSATVSQTYGGAAALGHLWYEFCQEIRYRWENSVTIDGLLDGFPNSRTGLLHQKLQMINVCIDRRKRRDEAAMFSSMTIEESSDEEFFDCDTDEESSTKKEPSKPVGRLSVFGNMKLIETGEPMYVPMTQEPVPKTEDQLEQDAEVMLNLGTDAQASEMRANIMSASLLSDMESFKAANPDGIFEDFIRWYSPKDWIKLDELDEFGQEKGHLSTRMVIEDNVWIQVWRSAKSVPAKRQKRLFDDTTEAEKTLHFLESRTISQIVDLLLPSLTHAVLSKLAEECKNKPELTQLSSAFDKVLSTAVKLTRDRAEIKKYKLLAEQLYSMELAIAQCKSLNMKFDGERDEELIKFFTDLLNGEEADIPNAGRGNLGKKISKMFQDVQNARSGEDSSDEVKNVHKVVSPLPPATEKEYVLRVMARRPVPTSTSTPQMMRAIIKKSEFRIVGAFAEDIIFA